jgi:hypothetical protein
MSRPQKTADKRRSRHVIFRLTEAEYDLLRHKAELAGLSPNELARRLTRKGRKTLVIRTSKRCDPAFLKRIDQLGHNLNQLVKNAHIFKRVSPQVDLICGKIDRVIDEALKEDGDDS